MVRIGHRLFGVISTKPSGTRINSPPRTTSARRCDSSVGNRSPSIPTRRHRSIAPGILRDEAIRRALDEKAIAADRFQHAAQPIAGLEQHQLRLRQNLGQPMRRRQTADAPADDGDAGDGQGSGPIGIRCGKVAQLMNDE